MAMEKAKSFTNEVFDLLKEITQIDWFTRYGNNGVLATWLNKYSVPFALIITEYGLCFNFNMINSLELLKTNETSSDFHYKADLIYPAYIPSLDSNTFDLNQSAPWSSSNNRRNLLIYFNGENYRDDNPLVEKGGYHVIFHNSFELPSGDEKNHVYVDNKGFLTVDIIPTVFEADDSLMDLNSNEQV
jgi:hypothetical protein